MDRIRERLAGMREQQDEGEASAREPWAPQRGSDGTPLTVREIVGQAIGTGSVCWDPRPSGVFDSETASWVVDGAVAALANLTGRPLADLPDAGPYVEPGLAEAAAAVRAPHATVCESCEMVGGHAPSCTLHPPRGFWASPAQGADYLRDLIEESSSAALAEPLENVPSAFLLRGVNGEPLLMVHVMAVGS